MSSTFDLQRTVSTRRIPPIVHIELYRPSMAFPPTSLSAARICWARIEMLPRARPRVGSAACAHGQSAGLSCTCGADACPYTPHSWCPPLPHHWLPHHWLASPMIIARGGMHGGMHGGMQGKYYRYCSRSIRYSTDLNSENNKFDLETFDLV